MPKIAVKSNPLYGQWRLPVGKEKLLTLSTGISGFYFDLEAHRDAGSGFLKLTINENQSYFFIIGKKTWIHHYYASVTPILTTKTPGAPITKTKKRIKFKSGLA